MPITGKYFPSQKPQEKVFLLLRRHWFTYAGFVFITLIMLFPLFLFVIFYIFDNSLFDGLAGNIAVVIAPAYALGVLALNLYGFVDYYLDIYIVTNERIVNIVQNGFFKREVSELHLHQVQDVNAAVKGIFPTMFHYGDILIQTAGEKENFIFKSIPHPYRVSRKIIDLLEEALEQRAVQEEKQETQMIDQSLTSLPATSESKTIENVTGINPSAFKLARSRTKDFLSGSDLKPVDKNLSTILPEVSSEESDEILSFMDKDEAKSLLKNDNKEKILSNIDQTMVRDMAKEQKAESKLAPESISIAKSEKVITPQSADAGELTENKEVDLNE